MLFHCNPKNPGLKCKPEETNAFIKRYKFDVYAVNRQLDFSKYNEMPVSMKQHHLSEFYLDEALTSIINVQMRQNDIETQDSFLQLG